MITLTHRVTMFQIPNDNCHIPEATSSFDVDCENY